MNDRYLYRAKTKLIVGTYNCGKEDGEWVKGYLYCDTGRWMIKQFEYDRANYIDYEVDPSTICQCTAVPDRDNTIMFENDVVRASGGVRGVIRFGRYADEKTDYGFYIEWEKSQPYWRNDIYYWQNELRVIGSYIDNPELLEVGE